MSVDTIASLKPPLAMPTVERASSELAQEDSSAPALLHQSGRRDALVDSVIEFMEQGVLVWSDTGVCEMYNNRVFEVLELSTRDLSIGLTRREFLGRAVKRDEISENARREVEEKFAAGVPFSFDRTLPTGRVVTTMARPLTEGGFVVTFTDVSEARRNESELATAKSTAEKAESLARKALQHEQARERETRLLAELGEWLQSCKSLDEVYDIISRFMARLFPASRGELFIYSNSRDGLVGACGWNCPSLLDHIQADDCWALRRGRMYKYGFGLVDFACSHVSIGEPCDSECQEYLCIPIIAHGDTVGLLHIRFEPDAGGNISEVEAKEAEHRQSFALRCSEQISLAIANVKLRDELRDQSTKDPLTGLYNRRYFLERFRREISVAERNGTSIGLISFDADSFKKLNDNYGHDAGDIVLRSIADTLYDLAENGETPCRFGGEEFTMLVPGCNLEETMAMAERIRSRIEETAIRYRDNEILRVTVSLGVATYPQHGRIPNDILNTADEALYKAKAAGKNQASAAG